MTGNFRDLLKKRSFFIVANNLFSCLLLVLFGFSFSTTNYVKRDSACTEMSILAKKSEKHQLLVKTSFDYSAIKPQTVVNNNIIIQVSTYNSAFEYHFNSYIVSCYRGGETSRYDVISNGVKSSGFAAVSFNSFSDGKVCEMSNIYLYNRNASYLSSGFSGLDGRIYIPDFYADQIIEQSNGLYKTYDDILNAGCTISLSSNNDTKTHSYRICNIFMVKGFKNVSSGYVDESTVTTSLTDIRDTLGSFVIVVEKGIFGFDDGFYSRSFVYTSYMHDNIRDGLLSAGGHFDRGSINFEVYSNIKGQLVRYERSDELGPYFSSTFNWFAGVYGVYFVLAVFSSIFYIVFCILTESHSFIDSLLSFSVPVLCDLVYEIFYAAALPSFSYSVLSFFNIFVGGAFVALSILWIFIPFFMTFLTRKNDGSIFERTVE
jgi:hypothetical protein